MIRQNIARYFTLAVILLPGILMSGCNRGEHAPAQLVIGDLLDGDLIANRSPPFIPSEKVKGYIDQRVCICGKIHYLPDGKVLLTEPDDRYMTSMGTIDCQPVTKTSRVDAVLGSAYGILKLQPKYDSIGLLSTLYRLEQCTFIEDRAGAK